MPAYDICYLGEDGALVCAFTVQFESAMRAKILAHAMRPAECHRMEVWRGQEMIYRRPEATEARRPLAQGRPGLPGFAAGVA